MPPSQKHVKPWGLFLFHVTTRQTGNVFLYVATYCSAFNKTVLSSLFQQMFYEIEERKSQFLFFFFFPVFRWWTSQAVVFVFAE